MADQDDVLQLIEDDARPRAETSTRRWKIAVIDDDAAVHEGTRFALSDYVLNGQTLEIVSAYSGAEGEKLMRENPDIAAVLLDVIMETDAAGLQLVEYIRNELKNETVCIILRTGQPGQAPERRVIVDYDINDYKAKTELTADKLFTSLTAALRSYQQLERMVQTRRGLEIIIDAASTLYDFKSMQRLAEGVLTQIASLLNVDCAGILVLRDGKDGKELDDEFSVLAGSGCYRRYIAAHSDSQPLDPEVRQPRDLAHVPGFVEVASVRRDQGGPRGGERQRVVQRVEKVVVELAGEVDRTRPIQGGMAPGDFERGQVGDVLHRFAGLEAGEHGGHFGQEMRRLHKFEATARAGPQDVQRGFDVAFSQGPVGAGEPLDRDAGIHHANHGRPFSRADLNWASVTDGAAVRSARMRSTALRWCCRRSARLTASRISSAMTALLF